CFHAPLMTTIQTLSKHVTRIARDARFYLTSLCVLASWRRIEFSSFVGVLASWRRIEFSSFLGVLASWRRVQ
ncbi:MAG TPA: hypothetical protein VJ834_14445, partial [Burkholderiales bacterium]|nr:hypothetical protein [Burkholderiales bacterium]